MLKKIINWLSAKDDFSYTASMMGQDLLKNKSSFEKELKNLSNKPASKKKAVKKTSAKKKTSKKKTAVKKPVKKTVKKK